MASKEFSELECMLVVIYKKLDDMERRDKGGFRSAPLSSYYEELKEEAEKVKEHIQRKNEHR